MPTSALKQEWKFEVQIYLEQHGIGYSLQYFDRVVADIPAFCRELVAVLAEE